MTEPTGDDELLAIVGHQYQKLPGTKAEKRCKLLVNLRNAEATFGQGTPPYEAIRTTVKEHLESMKANGISTNLTGVRQTQQPEQNGAQGKPASTAFGSLAYRPKPGS